ncbi:hypothetical protein SELMODRAFT_414798 [Selaginella moellendorffii]|uniref:Dirigent protein n=1 Tax=Selaginella moellendorffii TaxID=88036 RepID=D8RUN4_SELML|nr:hypothetical protein SELMODRAFT_414798 [Selaginella moellendorffii]
MQAPQMGPYTGTMITTELIQKYLDENKQLILAILDNQNLGKLHECAAYQSKLQQNLMYLAAIADAQPQNPLPGAQSFFLLALFFLLCIPCYVIKADSRKAQQRQQQFQQQQRLVTAAASAGMLLQPPHSELELGGAGNVSNGNNMTGMGGAFPDYAGNAANGDLMRNSAAAAVSGDASKGTSAVAGSSGATAADAATAANSLQLQRKISFFVRRNWENNPPPSSSPLSSGMGIVRVIDSPIHGTRSNSSECIGRLQGYSITDAAGSSTLFYLTSSFNGSTIKGNLIYQGRASSSARTPEVSVTGTSGVFRFAKGYSLLYMDSQGMPESVESYLYKTL